MTHRALLLGAAYGSLLHVPRNTPIVVPYLPRENVLSTDLAFRLGQLGFTRVLTPRWWETLRFGDIEVQVLPFLGVMFGALALITLVPDLVLALPRLLGYKG